MLEGADFDDLDDSKDSSSGYRSLVDGIAPVLKEFESRDQEAEWVADEILKLTTQGYATQDICVVGRTRTQLKSVRERLERSGVGIQQLNRDAADNGQIEGVRLANMHRIKGLEFKVVFLVGINQGMVPLELAMSSTDDPVEKKMLDVNERALLHVAATRAVNSLYINWYGAASVYLDTISR